MSYDELLRDMERALVAIDASKPYRYEPTTSLPALSSQMQAALDAEAEMVASVVKRAREMAAELEALRARVAVLERVREAADNATKRYGEGGGRILPYMETLGAALDAVKEAP